jgi:hypothetical protein
MPAAAAISTTADDPPPPPPLLRPPQVPAAAATTRGVSPSPALPMVCMAPDTEAIHAHRQVIRSTPQWSSEDHQRRLALLVAEVIAERNGAESRKPKAKTRKPPPSGGTTTTTERGVDRVCEAVDVAVSSLGRLASNAAPLDPFMHSFGDWIAVDMLRLRQLEGLFSTEPMVCRLESFILDWILSVPLDFSENEEIYDGPEQKEFREFIIKNYTQFCKEAARMWMVAGYVAWTIVPTERFGGYPRCLSLSESRHFIRSSGCDTQFFYVKETALRNMAPGMLGSVGNGEGSGSGMLNGILGNAMRGDGQSLLTFDPEVRSAFSIDANNQIAQPARESMWLMPGVNCTLRPKPRIFTTVFDHAPSASRGIPSRLNAAFKSVEDSQFFVENAKQSERDKRRIAYITSRPPPPKIDPNVQFGMAMGADLAGGACPSIDPMAAMADASALAAGGSGVSRTLTHRLNERTAPAALQHVDMTWKYGQEEAHLRRHGLTGAAAAAASGPGDDVRGMGPPRPLLPFPRSINGAPIVELKEGEKLEAPPPPPGHDDPVRVVQYMTDENLAAAFGIPLMLFRHASLGNHKTAAVGQNDPAYMAWAKNAKRFASTLSEMCGEAYRHTYVPEAASRIAAGRKYKPGPLVKERKRAERKTERANNTQVMRRKLSRALEYRALGQLVREQKPPPAAGTSTTTTTRADRGDHDVDWSDSDDDYYDSSSSSDSDTEMGQHEVLASWDTIAAAAGPQVQPSLPQALTGQQRAALVKEMAKRMQNARNVSVQSVSRWFDALVGGASPTPDLEKIMYELRLVQRILPYDDKGARRQMPPNDEERIRNIRAVFKFPAMQTIAGAAFAESKGYFKKGAFKKVLSRELEIPENDLNDVPQFLGDAAPAAGAAGAGAGSSQKSLSRIMTRLDKQTSVGPSVDSKGYPRPTAQKGPKKTKPPAAAAAASADSDEKKKPKKKKKNKKPAAAAAAAAAAASDSDSDSSEKKKKKENKKAAAPSKKGKRKTSELSDDDATSDDDEEEEPPKKKRKAGAGPVTRSQSKKGRKASAE